MFVSFLFSPLFEPCLGNSWFFEQNGLLAKLPILFVLTFCSDTSFCSVWTGFKRRRPLDLGLCLQGWGGGCWRSPSLGSPCGCESLLGGALEFWLVVFARDLLE